MRPDRSGQRNRSVFVELLLAFEQYSDGGVQPNFSQHRAADVAVGDRAQQAPLRIDHKCDSAPVAVDAFHGRTYGRVGLQEQWLQLGLHDAAT